MKNYFYIFLFLYSMLSYAGKTVPVSMVHLICCSEKYVGQSIQVQGYFMKSGSVKLFLSKESADNLDSLSSITIEDKSKEGIFVRDCLNQHVTIRGVLSNKYGYYAIRNVESIRGADGNICNRK